MTLTSTTGLRVAVAAAVAALFVVLATPTAAFAGDFTVSGSAADVGETPGTSSVKVMPNGLGESKNVRVSVSATGEAASFVNVEVVGGSCKGNGSTANCGKMRMTEMKDFSVEVSLKPDSGLKDGEQKTGNLEFKVEGSNSGGGTAPITVTGFEQVAKVIKGSVTDVKNKPISGAKVNLTKSGTKLGSATTGEDGTFSVDAEVEPGTKIDYTITKKGFEKLSSDYTVEEGKPIQIDARMDAKVADKTEAPKEDNNDPKDPNAGDEGFTPTTWILIILGVLLAIGGGFAIWMLLRKGKEEDDEDDLKALPPEPVTHQLSASQTGKFGVYEGSGIRPGADNPTMIHNGPLINDNDLARYGAEPPSAAGFGPAYGDARPTQAVQSAHDLPPAGATQRYPSAEPTSGASQYHANEPYSGSTQRYPAADPVSGAGRYPNEPVSGSTQRYPAAEPSSGAGRYSNEPASGGWRSNEPVSGYPAAPVSGGWRSNEPASGAAPRYPSAEPTSGAWGSNQPASGAAPRYPSADPYYDRDGYGDERSAGGRHYREPDPQPGGYDDQQSRRSSGRRYRDDDYGDHDDRPRSW